MSEHEQIIKELTDLKQAVTEIVTADRILTLHQAAEFLGITPKILNKKLSRNEIKYYKPQGAKLIYLKVCDLMAWIDSGAIYPCDNKDSAAALLALKQTSKRNTKKAK